MPTTPVNNAPILPALRKAISALKAAIVVSAAAILSQAESDLHANASAALGHLDDFAAQLHAIRDKTIRPAVLATKNDGDIGDIDRNALIRLIGIVDDRSARMRQALYDVVGSPDRDGLDLFVERVGELGSAVDEVSVTLTALPSGDAAPFRYDQFFLESMHDLSQRDWSAP